MYCKYCGKEISDDEKYCPSCGCPVNDAPASRRTTVAPAQKKKKKKRHPILGAIILIFGISIFVGAINGGSNETNKNESKYVTSGTSATDPSVFTVGDTLKIGDIVVTLNDVYESNGTDFMKPSEGNIFVVCDFTIENNSDSEIAVSSMMSFQAYFDNYAANLSISAMTADSSKQQLDGTVAPGKKIKGIVGYEVPKDWSTLEVHYSANVFTSNSFVFNYSK